MNAQKRKLFSQRKRHPLRRCRVWVYSACDSFFMAQCFDPNENPRSPYKYVFNGNKVGVTKEKVPAVEGHWYEADVSAFECILIRDLGSEGQGEE